MPWKIEPKGDKFEVVEQAGGKHPGKVFGTFDTKAKAEEQLKALYANVKERAKANLLYRYASVDPTSADENGRTFQVAFSSEHPVSRKATERDVELGAARRKGDRYLEILSHADGDYDISQMNNFGALLDEHEEGLHLGNIKRAEVSADKIGRAAIWFDGITDLSVTRAKQMHTGSRPHVSFGYYHSRFIGDSTLPDGRKAKRFAWEGDEISSVANPADPKAGKNRSAADEKAHCLHCGKEFDRDELDDDFRCADCGPVARSLQDRMLRSADGTEISAHDLGNRVAKKAIADPRFHGTDNKGNSTGWVQVHDLVHDGKQWHARLYCGTDGKNYSVPISDPDGDLLLGDETEIERIGDWQPVEDMTDDGLPTDRAVDETERLFRAQDAKKPYGDVEYADPGYQADGKKRYPINTKAHAKAAWSYINKEANAGKYTADQLGHIKGRIKAACKKFGIEAGDDRAQPDPQGRKVDSENLVTEQANTIAKNLMELDESKIRADERAKATAELTPTIRKQFEDEQKAATDRLTPRNKEIHALADESVKLYGHRWGGKPNEVFIVGERIRKLEGEIVSLPADHDAGEARRDFKRRLDDLLQGSREPKTQVNAADLPESIASRCSLRNIYNAAARNKTETPCFIPNAGAEFEAHTEIHHRAADYPDGVASLGKGLILPMNTRFDASTLGLKRNRGDRFTRDALASDFGTAGAFIAPEFIFPYIELLRNKPALARAGMTILSGVMGGLVLPRLDAPTTPQSLGEGAQLAQYDQNLSQIKLEPHRAGTSQNYSRLALLQSSPDFEAMVLNDHMAVIALYIDEMGVNGQGAADQPLGILNQIGISVVTFNQTAATAYKNCVAMETAIRSANIYESISFLSTSKGRGTLRVTPATLTGATVVSGSTNAIWTDADDTDDGKVVGRPAVDSQQVPNDVIIALCGRHLVMAQWGGLAVVLDTLTRADRDEYKLSINTYIDFALRHAQAVCRSADSIAVLS